MNKPKLVFEWSHEAALRERYHGLLRAHGTRSCYDLDGGRGSKVILLSERYAHWLLRTARDAPEKARAQDLSRSFTYLKTKVDRWLAGWRLLDWNDVLLVDVQFIDWVVDDGVEMQIGTLFVAAGKTTVVCLVDELEARGDIFEIDRRLLETERRHLGGAAHGTGGIHR